MTFLDDNCIVFDTEEENKLEYTAIHQVILNHSFAVMCLILL
jgi:hypothetical protein